ncbi:hypothetical protein LWM68_31775 [Niabella sp. W65]|nr:hypothetical protein [Niabella sp. W65]MCH7366945.1 hypothetical protein [Niabella sp. W65]
MKRKTIGVLVLFFFTQWVFAQTTREEIFGNIEKTGGVYFAYPEKEIRPQTPVPEGYEPFI